MNRIKTTILWVIAITGILSTATMADIYGDFGYTTTSNQVTITGYTGSGGDISVPSLINGFPVTTIGEDAFYECTGLTNITIPDSVTTIDDWAFYECTGLTSISIGNGVTTIGRGAFVFCSGLSQITVDPNNPSYHEINDVLFSKDQTTIILYPAGKTGDTYTIPDSVATIGDFAFSSCTGLTSITIPDSVTTIGEGAFVFCSGLSQITVDSNNPSYHEISDVLFSKDQTTIILYPAGKTGDTYTIPDSVTTIGVGTFVECTSLTNITIPDSVTTIGEAAFTECTGLTNITIPDSVTTIGEWAFGECTGLTSISIGNGVTTIGEYEFDGCTGLTSISIGNGVTTIDDWAFYGYTGLSGVYFTGNAPIVGSYVFYDSDPTIYYLPNASGWGTTFAGQPTALWNPLIQTDHESFGVRSNRFGFNVIGATNALVKIEACEDITKNTWQAITTHKQTNGVAYFSDSSWTNSPNRFYRLSMP